MFSRKILYKRLFQVGGSTLLSRLLGMAREVLTAKFFGVNAIADAFVTAFKIPNSLRKIFAEGALSISFIPTFVHLEQEKKHHQINKLTTLGLMLFEGVLCILCALIIIYPEIIIRIVAPGWYSASVTFIAYTKWSFIDNCIYFLTILFFGKAPDVQVGYACTFLRILMSFILFLSTSALLSGPLQAIHHFFIPAISPVILNLFFIGGLLTCLYYSLSPVYLCWFIILGGIAQLIMHMIGYSKLGFSYELPDKETWKHFKHVWKKFLPSLFSASIMELYLLIDTSLASFLPAGNVVLIYYANRFMQIPLGVFATAISTILLPQFARIGSYAPKRIGFYILESTKLIFWVTLPATILMWVCAEKIFVTLFLSSKFTLEHVSQAGILLQASLIGLCFFSLNKILLSIFYGLHNTFIPMIVSIIAAFLNIVLSFGLMLIYGAWGIILATSICGIVQTLLFVYFLKSKFNITLYIKPFLEFMMCYVFQLLVIGCMMYAGYHIITLKVLTLPLAWQNFLLYKIGFWFWFMPYSLIFGYILYRSRRLFRISAYFLDF